MSTWTISPAALAATRAKIDKINARAAKRGFTGRITIDSTPPRVIDEVDTGGRSVRRVVVDVEIGGQAPCYGGWEFLAAVDAMPAAEGAEVGFVVRCAPGVDDAGVDRSALVAGRCEHCNVRVNRKYTYLVREVETGQYRQVGSTCIKDFTGWAGKPVFLTVEDVEDDLFGRGVGGGDPATTVEDAIATAYVAVQMFGWAASGQEGATRYTVARALFGYDQIACDLRAAMAARMGEGDAVAGEIIATLSAELTEPDGYEANVLAVLSAEYVTERELGLLCSAVPAYERIIGRRVAREAERKAEAEKVPSRWFASVGDKVTVTGAVKTALTIDGYAYNSVQRLIVIDTPGATFKMITSAGWAWDVHGGEVITVTAAVKRHDVYREAEQTVLVRPRMVGRATVSEAGAVLV